MHPHTGETRGHERRHPRRGPDQSPAPVADSWATDAIVVRDARRAHDCMVIALQGEGYPIVSGPFWRR